MVEIYERVWVFDEKQNGYLQSGRLQEVIPMREFTSLLPDTKVQEIYKFLAGKWDSLKTKK